MIGHEPAYYHLVVAIWFVFGAVLKSISYLAKSSTVAN